jgi:hypothetical protein
MSRPGGLPPLMETRKVLLAARPPVGEGPPTREVLAGLHRLRPPLPVLVAFGLMCLVPLTLLALSGWLILNAWRDGGVVLALVKTVLLGGIPFMLAALAWRGCKRALHHGSYTEAFFLARLLLFACGAVLAFLLWYVYGDGNPQETSMLVPFAFLAVAWAPMLPLQARSAKEWPDRVLLRGGPQVRGRRELAFLLEARPHSCGVPLPVDRAVEVADEEGRGWVWRGPCPACGIEAVHVFGLREADAPAPEDAWGLGRPGSLGGGDLWYLGERFALPAGLDLAQLPTPELDASWTSALAAVQVTEDLLALVPRGRDAVPPWRRTGRPVPLTTPGEVFGRARIEARLAERRAALVAVEAERGRRAG